MAVSPAATFERQQRMRDAAIELMFELGYAVSMDAVAQRAGCSKQTVYAHFGSKEGLFRSVVAELLGPIGASLDPDAADLDTALRRFARAHLEHLAQPRTVTAIRMLTTDIARFPDEARALFDAGALSIQRRLAGCLAAAMERGELRRDEPDALAELLLGMLVGFDVDRRRLGLPGRDTPAEREAWCDRVVDAFLRAHRERDATLLSSISPRMSS
ncbi:MAG TPA: TetR/AcrR family transcriptional regulator [Tahibacter sp.]|uniref:TetR/AcrR family transcriptional regulator n=1 Tax=Tahibacter sp. TaxID=2056211 RepID=UPI002B61A197|nr:TetR/AcrR family transcriptional regulator [Tahibacter sp.]HSX58609.1 TetR/AcrR family transcriptional regulator [Tahibacter sp.]